MEGFTRAVRLAGASSAIGLLLTPTLLLAFVEGLLGVRGWGAPTPRVRLGRLNVAALMPEIVYAAVSLVIGLAYLWNPLALLALAYPASLAYLVARFADQVS